ATFHPFQDLVLYVSAGCRVSKCRFRFKGLSASLDSFKTHSTHCALGSTTVTGNQNCYSVGNLFTDWSSSFPREVVECGLATIYPGTAFCRVLCIKVIRSEEHT